jgi:putative ABC transport system permease protein
MISNYLRRLVSAFLRQRFHSSINILGLATGIAAVLLMMINIIDELSYDRFHQDSNRIYRIGSYFRFGGNVSSNCFSDARLAGWLQQEVPQVESVLRLSPWSPQSFQFEDKIFIENNVLEVDTNFFSFFDFKLITKSARKVLSEPDKILITETTAKKYFGYKGLKDESPLGKILFVGTRLKAMEVAGIVEDPPSNSHFHFNVIVGRDLKQDSDTTYRNAYTYFKTFTTTNAKEVSKKFPDFIKKYTSRAWQDLIHQSGNDYYLFLQPLLYIHLDSHLLYELDKNGYRSDVYLMGAIAVLIILLASINFLNLFTAQNLHRIKEVAIRRAIGALRRQIMWPFMVDSYIYSGIAVFIALAIVASILGHFNQLMDKNLSILLLANRFSIMGIFIVFIITGTLAGCYPSFYLTSFKPIEGLRGKLGVRSKNQKVRNTLIILQYIISISLIIGTLVIYRQVAFMQNENLGFAKDGLMYVSNVESLGKNKVALKNTLKNQSEIICSSYSSELPGEIIADFSFKLKGKDEIHILRTYNIDHDNLKTLGYKLRAGRFFSPDIPTDSFTVVVNERAAHLLGISNLNEGSLIAFGSKSWRVIGIIEDFKFESLRSEIKPLILFLSPKGDFGGFLPLRKIIIRLTSGGETIKKIALVKRIWEEFSTAPFEYGFIDQKFNSLYNSEKRIAKITMIFTCLSIFITSLGLFGFVSYMVSARTKEIGIRKVIGASGSQITLLLSRDLGKLLLIAFTISLPVTWYCSTKWLEGFAYHVDYNILLAVASGIIVVIIALIAVGYHVIKASKINPVESLRKE